MSDLDNPLRAEELRKTIHSKPSLRGLYLEAYRRYAECLERCPREGIALELGSGGGFVKEMIPEMVTSDVLPYPGLDRVVDATQMPFSDGSLRGIFLYDVFHHIPNVAAFLREAERCLMPGGRILMTEPHPGWIGAPVYRFLHHEPYFPKREKWEFESSGPVSDANLPLAWMVFQRDRKRFEREFPALKLERYEPHTPLRYWLTGGLRKWSLLPGWAFDAASKIDELMIRVSPEFGSFTNVELVKLRAE